MSYALDQDGYMEVSGDNSRFYRYFDATPMVEALYGWVVETIETELVQELDFLVMFEEARRRVLEFLELSDRKLDLLLVCCLGNGGALSKTKRAAHFNMLTDGEVDRVGEVVRAVMGKTS